MRAGISITLGEADRHRLEALVADRHTPQRHVWRARIVLLSAGGAGSRRRCIGHVVTKFDGEPLSAIGLRTMASERLACRVLGQHRSAQRKAPKGRAEDAALTADIVALVTEYVRYGYRRIGPAASRLVTAVSVACLD